MRTEDWRSLHAHGVTPVAVARAGGLGVGRILPRDGGTFDWAEDPGDGVPAFILAARDGDETVVELVAFL